MAMTVTYDEGYDHDSIKRASLRTVILAWTSDGSGDASQAVRLVGTLVKATTNPGSAAPDDNYDITLTDDDGVNILTACDLNLTNRDTTNSEEAYFLVKDVATAAQSVHPVVCGTITVAVAAAGASKTGVIKLFLRD